MQLPAVQSPTNEYGQWLCTFQGPHATLAGPILNVEAYSRGLPSQGQIKTLEQARSQWTTGAFPYYEEPHWGKGSFAVRFPSSHGRTLIACAPHLILEMYMPRKYSVSYDLTALGRLFTAAYRNSPGLRP